MARAGGLDGDRDRGPGAAGGPDRGGARPRSIGRRADGAGYRGGAAVAGLLRRPALYGGRRGVHGGGLCRPLRPFADGRCAGAAAVLRLLRGGAICALAVLVGPGHGTPRGTGRSARIADAGPVEHRPSRGLYRAACLGDIGPRDLSGCHSVRGAAAFSGSAAGMGVPARLRLFLELVVADRLPDDGRGLDAGPARRRASPGAGAGRGLDRRARAPAAWVAASGAFLVAPAACCHVKFRGEEETSQFVFLGDTLPRPWEAR